MQNWRMLEIAWQAVRTVVAICAIVALYLLVLFTYDGTVPHVVPIVLVGAYCIVAAVLDFKSTVVATPTLIVVFWAVFFLFISRNESVEPFMLDGIVPLVFVCICFVASLYFLALYVRDVWSREGIRKRFEGFPYRFLGPEQRVRIAYAKGEGHIVRTELSKVEYGKGRDLIRELASQHEDVSLKHDALLMLRYPDDADILERELPQWEDYAAYDLRKGWPHTHIFEEELVSETPVEHDGSSEDLVDQEYLLTCACGIRKREVRRRRHYLQTIPPCCPECGCTDVRLEMHEFHSEYVCAGCHKVEAHDFTVERTEPACEVKILSSEWL